MGLFPLNIYHRVPRYPTNYPIGYPGNKLPGYGSPSADDCYNAFQLRPPKLHSSCKLRIHFTFTTPYLVLLKSLTGVLITHLPPKIQSCLNLSA